jgi:hypothetical protein
MDLAAGKRKIVRITIGQYSHRLSFDSFLRVKFRREADGRALSDPTIAVSVMCGVIVLISIGFAIWDYLSERDIRSKARKIVIASAAFDKQGRLLVRPDGHLPMHVIESQADLKVRFGGTLGVG